MNANLEFNSAIKECYEFASKIMYLRRNLALDKRDVVHSAFLLLHEKELHFSIDNMKKTIYEELRKSDDNRHVQILNTKAGIFINESEITRNSVECKFCNRCKESLPIGYFNKAKIYPSGFIVYQPVCKGCQYERNKENTAKRAADPLKHKKYLLKEKNRYSQKAQIIKNNPLLFNYFRDKRISKKPNVLKVA